MRRIGIGLLTLLLVLPAAWALDDSKDKKDKPDKKPETPAEEYKALVKEYQDKRQEYVKAYREAKTDAERREVIKEKNPKPATPAAPEHAQLDFGRADAIDDEVLNRILWKAIKGDVPYPTIKSYANPFGR